MKFLLELISITALAFLNALAVLGSGLVYIKFGAPVWAAFLLALLTVVGILGAGIGADRKAQKVAP